MTDDRSERLRKRRQAQETGDEATAGDADSESETDELDEPDEPSKTDDEGEAAAASAASGSIKDDQVGTYMYLPESQKKEIDRQYNLLKAEYEFEYDEPFEKNRHFFPLLVQYGLETLDGLDATEIRDLLESL